MNGMRHIPIIVSSAGALLLPACARVTVDPIEVKPIHIVADINLRVDRQLDEFFAFENKYPATTQATSTTQSK